MRSAITLILFSLCAFRAWGGPTAETIAADLRRMTLDPDQTYHVRDLVIARGDIKIYLTEGILSFARPVAGRVIAAIFTAVPLKAATRRSLFFPLAGVNGRRSLPTLRVPIWTNTSVQPCCFSPTIRCRNY